MNDDKKTSIQVSPELRDRLYKLKFRKTYEQFLEELCDMYENKDETKEEWVQLQKRWIDAYSIFHHILRSELNQFRGLVIHWALINPFIRISWCPSFDIIGSFIFLCDSYPYALAIKVWVLWAITSLMLIWTNLFGWFDLSQLFVFITAGDSRIDRPWSHAASMDCSDIVYSQIVLSVDSILIKIISILTIFV